MFAQLTKALAVTLALVAVSGQRSLHAAAADGEFPLQLRFKDDTRAIEISKGATVADLYEAAAAQGWTRMEFALQHSGMVLEDMTALIADLGVCSEAVIEMVEVQNDLQTLDAMITTDPAARSLIWKTLTEDRIENYAQLEEASLGSGLNVMQEMERVNANNGYMELHDGRVISLSIPSNFLNVEELWRISGLSALQTLKFGVEDSEPIEMIIPLLASLHNLRHLVIHNMIASQTITFPEMELESISLFGCQGLINMDVSAVTANSADGILRIKLDADDQGMSAFDHGNVVKREQQEVTIERIHIQ